MPVAFLNSLLKCDISVYPDIIAVSVTEYIFDSSSSFAIVILRLFMYLIGEKPNDYDKVLGILNEMLKEGDVVLFENDLPDNL